MKTQDTEPESDPFLCTCGPCRRFWQYTFSAGADLLREPSVTRTNDTAILGPNSQVVRIGDRVLVKGQYPGTVKYIGVLNDSCIAPELYIGVKLDDNVNSIHNGVYKGKRYFHCPRGHGAMVKYSEVTPLKRPEVRPPLTGNVMFPSYEEVRRHRRERSQKLQTVYTSAGMTGPKYAEPYTSSRSLPLVNSGRSSAVRTSRQEQIIHISDPNDIALKDRERKAELEKTRKKTMRENLEQREMDRLTEKFGGGQEGERLALTYKKLQKAYQDGKVLMRRRSARMETDRSSESDISD